MVMTHDEAAAVVREGLDSVDKHGGARGYMFSVEAVRVLLGAYEAAVQDMIAAVGGQRCAICVNDECHYNDDEEIVACSAGMFKWRGPQPGREHKLSGTSQTHQCISPNEEQGREGK